MDFLKPLNYYILWDQRDFRREGTEKGRAQAEEIWPEKYRRPCLVANRATFPQKWPTPSRNVVDSCEITATTEEMSSRHRKIASNSTTLNLWALKNNKYYLL